ncbi:2-(hydroxymethyl)glutarate dehydrogenase [Propionibacterium australiense]|uniref:6-phosphogluconate dehydrogenase C-terminal domain-like n=2 Tax=Propionibacterium australiense TaxID=119981 RepID=A0A383S7S2_9ACTN|nr:6-phosphogluconate dehydrogenase C-terminal domain-like [Propionibacterium australiense]VEH89210.1 2-(hydroxymethyl)glutarate dehydrogenase [Propionibacterium australiense]
MTMATTVGFIGANGLMGHGMAKNIAKAGFDLVYTVHRSAPADLEAMGARRVASNAELGAQCEIVVICITTAQDVQQVVAGPDGLLTDPREGLVIVDAATSEPAVTRELAARAAAAGVAYADAPLTRGPAEAEQGRLNTLVGADDEVFARIEPVLASYCENILRAGPVGAGHTVKLLNNFCLQAATTALAESFTVARAAGADPQTLVDVLGKGMFDNQLLAIMGATLGGDYERQQFALGNARKDVRYYTRLAGDVQVAPVVGDGVHEALSLACSAGYAGHNVPWVAQATDRINGLTGQTC